MKSTQTIMLFYLLISFHNTYSQIDDSISNGFYIGLTPGVAYNELGYSRFIFKFGGTVYYNIDDSFINLSYNRFFGLHFSFGENNKPDNSSFEKSELIVGHSIRLHKTHPLFKHICFTFDGGISYSNINYYKNDSTHYNNSITNLKSFGVPIGLGFTNDWNGLLFTGFEYRFNIVQHLKPYDEFNVFLVFNVL